MGQNSTIGWTHHTFNPWRGCTKISAGCDFCYADTLSLRNPRVLGVWGPRGVRVAAGEAYWRQPFKWDRLAAEAGQRHRVFCASLADVFEGPETMPADAREFVAAWRDQLFATIALTPHLDWLLLTKRPHLAAQYLTEMADPDVRDELLGSWISEIAIDNSDCHNRRTGDLRATAPIAGEMAWPMANVWMGASAENQEWFDKRRDDLLACPAAVRFVSLEPLIGPIDMGDSLNDETYGAEGAIDGTPCASISWVIVGCESGGRRRPMDLAWARSFVEQCKDAGVACFVKQIEVDGQVTEDVERFPEDMRVRQFPAEQEVRT